MLRLSLLLLLALTASGGQAVELTLLYGGQDGGQLEHIDSGSRLSFAPAPVRGLIIGSPLNADQGLELLYSRQQTRLQQGEVAVPAGDLIDLDIHYLHLGGTVLSEPYHGAQAFLSGGLGFSHFNPSPAGADTENRASLSLGVGGRWMPTQRVGLRLEARGFGSLFNSNMTLFCSGGCQFSISGDMLYQYALFAGLVVRLD